MSNILLLYCSLVHLIHFCDLIIYIYIYIHTVPSKSIGTVKTKLLCWLWSQDICKYVYNMNMWQNYRMSHFIIEWLNTDVLPAKKCSTFRVSSPSDVSISIGTVASRVFLSDQLCPVALILQVLKAGNLSYQLYPLLLYSESCIRWWHTQTRMKTRELILREN